MNSFNVLPTRHSIYSSSPMTRHMASNGGVNFTSRTAIEPAEMLRIAPSVFAEHKHISRSDRYAYIPTSEILARLATEGFRPFSVMQGGSRDEDKRGFTKHLIRLRHDSMKLCVGDTHNEIVLMNSHDGTSAYRLSAGVYRCICTNGLVVDAGTIDDVRIHHKGDVAGLVLDGCIELMGKLPEVSESVREMAILRLTEGEARAYASAALVARYGEEEAPVTPDQLLTIRRQEDAAPTVWNVLNRTQESVIRGGLGYTQRNDSGRSVARRRTRQVNGIDQNTNLNRALWKLAEEMRKLKA